MRRATALLTALLLGVTACQDAGDTPEATDTMAAPAPEPAPPVSTAVDGVFNPETATREELLQLPGMTEAFADQIIAARPIDNMLEVDGVLAASLTEEQRDTLYMRLWKPLDLNTATAQEILLIPGVGPRLQHEFEEYRPYTDMAQFRREIGKYVDSTEVARLERYIVIRGS